MPNSTMSLESLSSPSPSPSPEPNQQAGPAGPRLDSDSDLSELTEDEQEPENPENQRKQVDDGDDDDEENNDSDQANRRQLRPSRRGGRRQRGGIIPAPMWDWAKPKTANDTPQTVVEEEEEEEVAEPPKAMEEEEEEEDEGGNSPANSRPHRSAKNLVDDDRRNSRQPEKLLLVDTEHLQNGSISEDNDTPQTRVRRSVRVSRPASLRDDSDEEADPSRELLKDEEDGDDDDDDELSDVSAGPGHDAESDNENDTESEDEDTKILNTVEMEASTIPISSTTLMDIDDPTSLAPKALVPLAIAAAASSIMAGSEVVNAPSPSPSSASSASVSPASSRSPSPIPDGADEEPSSSGPKRDPKQKLDVGEETRTLPSHKETAPAAKEIATNHIADIDIPEHDISEDIDIDEPLPEDVEMELESDLQPAHRAEALDVLATIELKFALLRERVYMEKMEGLAWEETLVANGTHPELIHLHAELSRRRDKRLDLATRKRGYEIANVTKRRKVDEEATWSWWKLAKEELQTDMISETNRKRRKLERERRAVERPQPIRRMPNPPQEALPPPTLRKIVQQYPFSNTGPHLQPTSNKLNFPSMIYPELTTLSANDISSDLEFLTQHRRPPAPERLPMMGPPVAANGYDAYSDGMNIPPFGFPRGMLPPPHPSLAPQPFQQGTSGQAISGYGVGPGSGPGRVHHHLPLHNHNPVQGPYPLDQEMGGLPPHHQPLPPPHHQYFGSSSVHAGPGNGRRSISPVNVTANGSSLVAGKQNGWNGMGMGYHGGASSKAGERVGEGRRDRDLGVNDEEERERAREWEKERERESRREKDKIKERDRDRDREHQELERERERERERYHMQQVQHQQIAQQQKQLSQQQQTHRHPSASQHQHVHPPPGQTSHHHHVAQHHHHHHHHVVHHHHTQQQQQQQQQSAHGSASAPPPSSSVPLSPRTVPSREFDNSRSHQGFAHPTEVINLSSSSKPSIQSHWKGDDPHQFSLDYRDLRGKHNPRPSSGPPPPIEDRERPLAMPFVMASTITMQSSMSASASTPMNGNSPPRPPWNPDDHNRSPSSGGYNTTWKTLPRPHPPPLSRQGSIGLSSPRVRPHPPASPSSTSAYPAGLRSPTRFGPPPPPPPPSAPPPAPTHPPPSRSPSLKLHQPTSPAAAASAKHGVGSAAYSPHIAAGPPGGVGENKATTAVSTAAFATGSGAHSPHPHLAYPSPSVHSVAARPVVNGGPGAERRGSPVLPRLGPVLPPPKMNVAQMVDGH